MKEEISCVICAYNEGPRIKAVLDTVIKSKNLNEIIVVDDGSNDNTAKVVEKYRKVRLIKLRINRGKANAIYTGITKARNDLIMLIDADYINLREEHISDLSGVMRKYPKDFSLGMLIGEKEIRSKIKTFGQIAGVLVTGFKGFNRKNFTALTKLKNNRYEGDIIMCNDFLRRGRRLRIVKMKGLTLAQKYDKVSFTTALVQYFRMYLQTVKGFFLMPPVPTDKKSLNSFLRGRIFG